MKYFATILFMSISIFVHAQLANDMCANAIQLMIDGSCTTYDNTGATASNMPQGRMLCGSNDDLSAEDMWFVFQAIPSGNVTVELSSVTGGPNDMIMELYEGSCNALTPIECSYYKLNNNVRMPLIEREGLVPGIDYYLRISSVSSAPPSGQFQLCIRNQGITMFSDKVELVIPVGQSACDPATNSYTQDMSISYRNKSGNKDKFYMLGQFYDLMPSPFTISITNVPANSGWQNIDPQLSPFGDGGMFIDNGYQRLPNCYSGIVSNDECTDAIVLSADNACFEYTGDNTGATHSGLGGFCEPFGRGTQDIWFEHTISNTDDLIINFWELEDFSPSVLIYTGNCGSLSFLDCAFTNEGPRLSGLTIGETIYIRIKDTNDNHQGKFGLCLINPVSHTNDICDDAVVISPSINNCNESLIYSDHFNVDESAGVDQPSCTPIVANDSWYLLQADQNGFLGIEFNPVAGDLDVINVVEVYAGSCNSLQLIHCQSDKSRVQIFNRAPNEQLYLRKFRRFKPEPYLICQTGPTNDYCSGAINIPTGSCISATTQGSTASNNPYVGLLCGNVANDDIWFYAEVPASGNLTIETYEIQNGSRAVFAEVYEGIDCSTLIPLACNSNKYILNNFYDHFNIELEGRTPGETIFIRIMTTFFDKGEFEICVMDSGFSEPCKIELIELGSQSNCNPMTNTFTQDLMIHYRDNGNVTGIQIFDKTITLAPGGSPALITVELPSSSSGHDIYARLIGDHPSSDCTLLSRYTKRDAIASPSPCSGPVVNDLCSNALPLMVNTACVFEIYDNTGATYSYETGFWCYSSEQPQNVWFTVEVPASGELTIQAYQTSVISPVFAIYEGTCNNLTLVKNCGNTNTSLQVKGRQQGEILYVNAYSSNPYIQGEFGICAVFGCFDDISLTQDLLGIEDYEARNTINSSSKIRIGAIVDHDAGQSVHLDAGFEVETGAVFHAFIDGCGGSQ